MVEVFRARVSPEVGFWEECGLLVIAKPGPDGVCLCYRHERRDLPKAKAEEVVAKIYSVGQIDPSNGWSQQGSIHWDDIADK